MVVELENAGVTARRYINTVWDSFKKMTKMHNKSKVLQRLFVNTIFYLRLLIPIIYYRVTMLERVLNTSVANKTWRLYAGRYPMVQKRQLIVYN